MEAKNILYYIFSVVRVFLYPFALLYGAVLWLRNRMYDAKIFTSIDFSIPVITVGNLSTGGTGKTPHVEYLIRLLQYRFKVATMSRGYKRHTQGFLVADWNTNALKIGDEPMQYHIKFPELVVSVAEERMLGIPALVQRHPEVDVILLDDAYQHRSVKPGFSILITDYAKPFYKDFILPFGNLREGRAAYKRASVIVVSKCPQELTKTQADGIEAKINPLPNQKVFFTSIQYGIPFDFFSREPVDIIGKNLVLVCGIARPEPLVDFLKANATEVHPLSYPDHHYFDSSDLEEMKSTVDNWKVESKMIITTEKDAARLSLHIRELNAWGITIAVLPIAVNMLLNKGAEFDAAVTSYVEQAVAEHNELFGRNTEPMM